MQCCVGLASKDSVRDRSACDLLLRAGVWASAGQTPARNDTIVLGVLLCPRQRSHSYSNTADHQPTKDSAPFAGATRVYGFVIEDRRLAPGYHQKTRLNHSV